MSDENLRYYERRAREEAEAARQAADPTVSSAHRLLAIEYEAHAEILRDEAADERAREESNA